MFYKKTTTEKSFAVQCAQLAECCICLSLATLSEIDLGLSLLHIRSEKCVVFTALRAYLNDLPIMQLCWLVSSDCLVSTQVWTQCVRTICVVILKAKYVCMSFPFTALNPLTVKQ